ncbi:inosine-uridine preferring nucleoside hydrolase isoform X2 [Syngnathus scovelli]|uniref:inosine-uridine preferring nucleoside hydrolase isoform X2 n=1 Tax=Syngnathus scovelli TaxID=161590 RepID=UPI00210FC8A6|nr:inosine-uridine preferring nucleoside hydrolase isoform X2 [Syngnathus scovelli]
MKRKIILDVDTGVDDAQAIMMALSAPDVEILGITCCHGNTPLERVLKNTLRVLKVCNRLDIPVYAGCSQPLLSNKQHASDYHGKDGLGDVPDPDAPGLELVQKKKGVQALIKMVKQNQGEVTLVATAPLTNLAVAVQLDPSLPKKLKALHIMGGNIESRGNTTTCGEFNFVADTEAAYIVLERYTCPTTIASWEFTCSNSLPWSFCDQWLSVKTEKAAFMKKISSLSMTVAVTVEVDGTCTRGMMVLDYMDLLKKKHKVTIMKKVDLEKFKQMLINALK